MKNREVKKKNNVDWSSVRDKIRKHIRKSFNKLKKLFARLCKLILKMLKSLKDKFMDLPKKARLIIYVWAIIIVLLLLLIVATGSSKKFYNKYASYESNISAAALSYVKDNNIFTTIDKKIIVDLAVLKSENYISDTTISDESCDGFSVIYYDDAKSEYIVDSYLNCKRYTSKYYWDYK